jgi:hypothetical protein
MPNNCPRIYNWKKEAPAPPISAAHLQPHNTQTEPTPSSPQSSPKGQQQLMMIKAMSVLHNVGGHI